MNENKRKKLEQGLNNLFSAPNQPAADPSADGLTVNDPQASNSAAKPVIEQEQAQNANATMPHIQQETGLATTARPDKQIEKAPQPAKPAKTSIVENSEEQLVVFSLAGEYYGLSIATVDGIIKMQNITIVPHAHTYIEGVTNLRGTVLPVIDLRTRFGMPRTDSTKDTRIVVVYLKGTMIGLVVDAVTEVLRIPSDIIEPPSLFVATLDSTFITGIAKLEDRLIIMLDLEKIFVAQEISEKQAA